MAPHPLTSEQPASELAVAFVVSHFPSASETFVLRQVRCLTRAGARVTVFARHVDAGAAIPGYTDNEVQPTVIHLPEGQPLEQAALHCLRWMSRASVSSRARRRLLGVAEARLANVDAWSISRPDYPYLGRFDTIIAHFGPNGLTAMCLRRAGLLDGPIATFFHGYDMSERDTLERHLRGYARLFRETELLLPISQLWASRLRAWGAPSEKVRVLHMGVDVPPMAALRPFARPLHEPLHVVTVGRFTEKKGIRYAIEGVRRCQVPVELSIIGFGELEEELRGLAEQSTVNPIRFLGKCPHPAVLERLEQADVFLLPSVTATSGDMEGIPVAVMEAMSRGCLVIASRHSGIGELVTDGESGILVPERNGEQIAQALGDLASGRYDIEQMRQKARARVDAHFNNLTLDRELFEVVEQLALSGEPARPGR